MRTLITNIYMSDADYLLSLKNDSTSRRFAIKTHRKIKKSEHRKWLKKTLENKAVIYYMIINERYDPCGTIRFDESKDSIEVAIHLSKYFRGKGIGTSILSSLCPQIKKEKKKKLTARIVDDNMRSLMVFLKCGFSLVKHENKVSYLESAYHG